MLIGILILAKISVISSFEPIDVEFNPSDFVSDLDVLWKYYTNGGDRNDKAYIDIPKARFVIRYGEKNGELFLKFAGTFTEDSCAHIPCIDCNKVYSGIYENQNGEFYGNLLSEGKYKFTKIEGARLRYNYNEETDKRPPYIAIRYASLEEIQTQVDDVFQDYHNNEEYYTHRSYAISPNLDPDGHFIQFIESYLPCHTSWEHGLDIRVLIGSIRHHGHVVTITGSVTEPFLRHDILSKKPFNSGLKYNKGAIGIRMATLGVLAKRDRQNDVSLFNTNHLDHVLQEKFININYEKLVPQHVMQLSWGDCFAENPPSRLEKGFKFAVEGQVFIKRCDFPIDSNNNEIKTGGKKIVVDIAIKNSKTKFIYNDTHYSLQLFLDHDYNLYMIVANTKLNIGRSSTIRYYF